MKVVGRVGVRRLVSLVAATSLGIVGAATLAAPASAGQPVSAIDTVTVSQARTKAGGVEVGSTLRVDATWSVADGEAKAGDTFTLTMPTDPRFTTTAMTFELLDQDSTQVGSCVATSTDVTCTFNDYVETHTDVHGTLFVWATAKSESSRGTATFSADGKAIVVPIPPIVPVGNQTWPSRPFKTGAIDHDRASWSVLMPGATLLAATGDITITDTYDARLGDLVAPPKIYWVTQSQWTAISPDPWSYNQYLSNPGDFTFTLDPANHSLTVTITNRAAIQADRLYILQYKNALPTDVTNGEIFTNHAAGMNWETNAEVTMQGAGGDAFGVTPAAPETPTPATPTPVPATPNQKMDTSTTPAVSSPSAAAAAAAAAKKSTLASTGATVLGAAGVALLLLAGGATILVIRRRKTA